jgi:thiamine monophosphate kinase
MASRPISGAWPGPRVWGRLGADGAVWALEGGEDFERLVAVAPRAFTHLSSRFAARFGRPLERIGTATVETGLRWADGTPIAGAGWDHVRGAV